ncbi:Protein kinase domain [Arabidopsis thaliana x Arabidopsis arenosa]|uniref:Protein kinase domain n=1 Tax=Arabidopsis thaliana x Arabidopsis arenosa TaxID=1240361 RepID=A0A8T2AAW3_9BRAS|nr:Protein kinase domain [Arabidopsis thaliana x Arabidopsis arenosa]
MLLLLLLFCLFLGLKWIRGLHPPEVASTVGVSVTGSTEDQVNKPDETPLVNQDDDTDTPHLTEVGHLNTHRYQLIANSTVYVDGKGRFGQVVDGLFEKRMVSVKVVDCNDMIGFELIQNEIALMVLADTNTSRILSYWNGKSDPSKSWQTTMAIQPTRSLCLKLIRDVTKWIAHLHSMQIVHRDLRPMNIYIVKDSSDIRAKIGDLRISRKDGDSELLSLPNKKGTNGWKSPEQIKKPEDAETEKSDMFNLRTLFYFTLIGKHPFKMNDLKIEKNSLTLKELEASSPSPFPEAHSLIKTLVNPLPEPRLSAQETLRHPVFWSSTKKIEFLSHIGKLAKCSNNQSILTNYLDQIAMQALGCTDWSAKLDPLHDAHLKSKGKYVDTSLPELLRAVRNTRQHYMKYQPPLQNVFPKLEAVFQYFDGRFPRLLIEVYNAVYVNCKKQQVLEMEPFFI